MWRQLLRLTLMIGMLLSVATSVGFFWNWLKPPMLFDQEDGSAKQKRRHLGSLCVSALALGWAVGDVAFLWPALNRYAFGVALAVGWVACCLSLLAVRNSRSQGYAPPAPVPRRKR